MAYTPRTEDHRLYELALLYPYPMPQKDEAALMKEIDALFAEADAKLVEKDAWGRRGIAYPIKGQMEANVVIYYLDMLPEKLKELDRQIRILKGVMRHMIVKPPKNYVIVPYAKAFDEWKERVKTERDQKARIREEELQRKVIERAKRAAKKPERKTEAPSDKPDAAQVTKQIDKLISDDSLSL